MSVKTINHNAAVVPLRLSYETSADFIRSTCQSCALVTHFHHLLSNCIVLFLFKCCIIYWEPEHNRGHTEEYVVRTLGSILIVTFCVEFEFSPTCTWFSLNLWPLTFFLPKTIGTPLQSAVAQSSDRYRSVNCKLRTPALNWPQVWSLWSFQGVPGLLTAGIGSSNPAEDWG